MARKKDPQYEMEMKKRFDKALSQLMSVQDWEEITVKNICQEAGVSVGLFYYYYKSKDQLMYTKFDKVDAYFDLNIRKEAQQCGFEDALTIYCQAYVEWIKRKDFKYMTQVMKVYLYDTPDPQWFTHRGLFTCLVEIFQSALAKKEIQRTLSAEEMAMDITLMMRGHIFEWCSAHGEYLVSKAIMRNVKIYYDWVSAPQ